MRNKKVNIRDIKLQTHVSLKEHRILQGLFTKSTDRSMSSFIRRQLLNPNRIISQVNGKKLLEALQVIGREHHKIGVNINQLAYYMHVGKKAGVFPTDVLAKHDALLQQYVESKQRLSETLNEFMNRL